MKAPGKNDEPKKPQLRFIRRRYRNWIGCCAPEICIALSFLIVLTGVSLLLVYKFWGLSYPDSFTMFKVAGALLVLGGSIWLFVYDTARMESMFGKPRQLSKPSFVGVCRPQPIHEEWLSAQLLPAVNQRWVPGDTLPGYEPYQGEFSQPPTRPKAISQEEEQPSTPVRRDQQARAHTRHEEQQSPASSRPDQQSPATLTPDQQSPATLTPDQQSPATVTPDQQSPAPVTPDQQSPASPRRNQQSNANVRRNQQFPANVRRNQQSPANVRDFRPTPGYKKKRNRRR